MTSFLWKEEDRFAVEVGLRLALFPEEGGQRFLVVSDQGSVIRAHFPLFTDIRKYLYVKVA